MRNCIRSARPWIAALACFAFAAGLIAVSGCGGGGAAGAVTSSGTSTGGASSGNTGGGSTNGTTSATAGNTGGTTATTGGTTGSTTTTGSTGATTGGGTGAISDADMVATWKVTEMAAGGKSTTCPGSFEINDGEVICTEDMLFILRANKTFELFEEGSLTEEGTWKLVGPTTLELKFESGLIWTYGLDMSADKKRLIAERNDEDLEIEVAETWVRQ